MRVFGNRSGFVRRPLVSCVRGSRGKWTRPAGFEPATSCSGGIRAVGTGEWWRVSDGGVKRFLAFLAARVLSGFRSVFVGFVREPFGRAA